jgi:hypothetical protein
VSPSRRATKLRHQRSKVLRTSASGSVPSSPPGLSATVLEVGSKSPRSAAPGSTSSPCACVLAAIEASRSAWNSAPCAAIRAASSCRPRPRASSAALR